MLWSYYYTNNSDNYNFIIINIILLTLYLFIIGCGVYFCIYINTQERNNRQRHIDYEVL